MRRLLCAALVITACFSDPPPGDDGATTSGSATETGGDTTTAPTGSTISISGDATSVGDSSSVSSDTVSAICGDGVPEGGEDCDDQNQEELDGCTSACQHGPRLLTMTVVSPDPAAIGSMDSSAFDETCFDGVPRVAERFYGSVAGAPPFWPLSVGGTCSGLGLAWNDGPQLQVVADMGKTLPSHGDFETRAWSVQCGAGAVPIGIAGRVYDDGGNPPYVRTLQLHCAALAVDPEAPNGVRFDDAPSTAWSPGEYDDPLSDSVCPAGAVLVGFRGDVDQMQAAVLQLGAVCATPSIAYGPV